MSIPSFKFLPVQGRLLFMAMLCLTQGCSGGGGGGSPTAPGGGGSNHAPTVNITAAPIRLELGQSSTFTTSASDQDGDQLTFVYTAQNGSIGVSGNTAMSGTISGSARGNAAVKVVASDGHGGSAQAVANLYFFNPNAPSPTISMTGGGCSTFTISSAETLHVLVVVTERVTNQTRHVLNNDFVPGILAAGQSVDITPDDCGHSIGDKWIVSYVVQRPLDGVSFTFMRQWNY